MTDFQSYIINRTYNPGYPEYDAAVAAANADPNWLPPQYYQRIASGDQGFYNLLTAPTIAQDLRAQTEYGAPNATALEGYIPPSPATQTLTPNAVLTPAQLKSANPIQYIGGSTMSNALLPLIPFIGPMLGASQDFQQLKAETGIDPIMLYFMLSGGMGRGNNMMMMFMLMQMMNGSQTSPASGMAYATDTPVYASQMASASPIQGSRIMAWMPFLGMLGQQAAMTIGGQLMGATGALLGAAIGKKTYRRRPRARVIYRTRRRYYRR